MEISKENQKVLVGRVITPTKFTQVRTGENQDFKIYKQKTLRKARNLVFYRYFEN